MSSDGTVRFWDVKTRNLLNEVKGLGEAFTLAWAPDGQHVVVGNKVFEPYPAFCNGRTCGCVTVLTS